MSSSDDPLHSPPQTMLAARLHAWQTPLQIDEVPVPAIGHDDVLIQTVACGFSASGIRMVSPRAPGHGRPEDRPTEHAYPFIPSGYPVGFVVGVGSGVVGVSIGDRVCVAGQVSCGVCKNCRTDMEHVCVARVGGRYARGTTAPHGPRGGALAQYFKAPWHRVARLPDEVSFAVGSQANALGTCYRAIKRTGLRVGESIIVSGATGNSGLRCVLLALAMGAGLVFALGRNASRLRAIHDLAPDRIHVVDTLQGSVSEQIKSVTDDLGADRMVDFVPAAPEATVQALYALRPGGRAVLVAESGEMTLNYGHIQKYAIEITGSSGSPYHDYAELFGLFQRGLLSLDGVELRPFPLSQVNEAIELMAERAGEKLFWAYLDVSS